jgi:uncharacterized membrane protein required for colicin V production
MFGLSLIDILFLVTVILLVLNGLHNGAVTSLVSLLSIPLGFLVAYLFGARLTVLLAANGWSVTPLLSYIILFFATVLILHILATIIHGVMKSTPVVGPFIGLADKLLGGVIGIVEAWLLWVVLLLVLHEFLLHIPSGIDAAQFRNWQLFYNDAYSHSLFAQVNSFILSKVPVQRVLH